MLKPKKIKSVIISYGYFNEEKGIIDFLKRKPFGWFITGNEEMFMGDFKGKQFYEIQNIIISNILKSTLDSNK